VIVYAVFEVLDFQAAVEWKDLVSIHGSQEGAERVAAELAVQGDEIVVQEWEVLE
jgi:hypothetical protein